MKDLAAFFGVVLLIALFICVPFVSIWALNTLFHTNIEFNLATWFASFWLTFAVAYKAKS